MSLLSRHPCEASSRDAGAGESGRRAWGIARAARHYFNQLGSRLRFTGLSFGQKTASNFDEELILRRFIEELLPPDHSRTAVDIGAGDGVKGSNTYALFRDGWRGLVVELSGRRFARLAYAYRNFRGVWACRCRVTPDNVAGLLRSYSVEEEFGVLSLDIDSYDYWVLDAVLASYRPRLIVTEINEKIPPPIKFVVKFDPDFELTHHFFGYSLQSLSDLCEQYDYALIGLEYNNAFLAPKELAGERVLNPAEAYRAGYLDRADRREKFAANHDVEVLQTLTPEEGVEFLERFFSKHRGRYEMSIATTTPELETARP